MSNLIVSGGIIPAEFGIEGGGTTAAGADGFCAADIHAEAGRIRAQGRRERPASRLDAEGCFVLPGFVDIHVHGAVGRDTMDADGVAVTAMAQYFVTRGVTSFFPTTMTAPLEQTLAAVRAVEAIDTDHCAGARIAGIHLEGPYISPRFPGAQKAGHIQPPDIAAFDRLVDAGPISLITLAPEVPGAADLIAQALRRNVKIVIGHTDATYEECRHAFRHGASQATHTFNAMSGLHHRHPGTLGAVLASDEIYAQLIADNIHVHPAAMKILARCKGVDRTILITDAMRATGLQPGTYELGGQPVTVEAGECRLADGTLAGSVLTMDRALVNFMQASELALHEAWPTTSRTPAAALGLGHEVGELRPGFRCDLVLLDEALSVVATVVGGRVAYLRDPDRLVAHSTDDDSARAGV